MSVTPLITLSAGAVKALLEAHNSGLFQDQSNRHHITALRNNQLIQPDGPAYTTTPDGAAWLQSAGLIH